MKPRKQTTRKQKSMTCRHCGSTNIVKNGSTTGYCGGKAYRLSKYRCKDCFRQTTVR